MNFNLILLFLFSLIGLPCITVGILSSVGNYTKDKLVQNFGIKKQISIGGIGVIVHEFAHYVTAKLFMHHINKAKFLCLHGPDKVNNLGYVTHSWNTHNPYAVLGNFFIGFAPCYVCSIVLWLSHKFLLGDPIIRFNIPVNSMQQAIQVADSNINDPFGTPSWQLLVYLILVVMIASTGYGLSKNDLMDSKKGLPVWLGLVLFFYCVDDFMGQSSSISTLLWKFVIYDLVFLMRGLMYLGIALVIIVTIAFAIKIFKSIFMPISSKNI